jgi:hypothetical protein
MDGREERIYQEASALWRELYGEPPPIRADGGVMLDIIMRSVPAASYERLRSPPRRPGAMTFPASEGARA